MNIDNSQITIKWRTPKPLAENYSSQPYPIDCLPEIIKLPVIAYQKYGQQPISLIASAALANISLACQSLANIARDHLLISPISLYFLIVASSGERKSAVDKAFSFGIRHWQTLNRERLAPEVRTAQILHHAWKAECDGIIKQIRKASHNGESSLYLQDQLKELMQNEPDIPLAPELFFEDITQEAFTNNLAHNWPSSSLWSDEAGIILSGYGMQNNTTKFIATLNRLWDGNPFITHRKTSKSFTVANRRLTMSLMLQPLLLEQLLKRSGGITRQSGFLARSLIAQPVSSMGNRYYQEPPELLTGFKEFHDRINGCLDESINLDRNGCHNIPTLTLSESAKSKWVTFFNSVEAGLSRSGEWLHIQDFASKSAENAARLAALLHLFTAQQGNIDAESVERAIGIIQWHLIETKKILVSNAPIKPDNEEAIKLLNWLKVKQIKTTIPRHLQQYGPIRDKKTRNKAIDTLIEHHYLHNEVVDGKTTLHLNPHVL